MYSRSIMEVTASSSCVIPFAQPAKKHYLAPRSLLFNRTLLLIVCHFLWRILQSFKHTSLIPKFVVAYTHSGLLPIRERPCRANNRCATALAGHRTAVFVQLEVANVVSTLNLIRSKFNLSLSNVFKNPLNSIRYIYHF